MTALRHFFLALQFFTRIPVTGRLAVWVGFSPAMLRASAAYFPAVGAVIGCLVVALTATLMYYLPTAYAPLVAAALEAHLFGSWRSFRAWCLRWVRGLPG